MESEKLIQLHRFDEKLIQKLVVIDQKTNPNPFIIKQEEEETSPSFLGTSPDENASSVSDSSAEFLERVTYINDRVSDRVMDISDRVSDIEHLSDSFETSIIHSDSDWANEIINHAAYTSVLESEASLKLCPICSNEAGRHNHYGGRGCSSCRAFFRRSVQNNAYKKFVCKSQQSRLQFCIIDSKSWKSCKFCRYHKCLESGMKPSFVLNEVERKVRHEKRTAKYSNKKSDNIKIEISNNNSNNHIRNNSSSDSGFGSSGNINSEMEQPPDVKNFALWHPPDDMFTEDDMLFLQHRQKQIHYHMQKELINFYSLHPDVFRSMLFGVYHRINLPFDTVKIMMGAITRFIASYFMHSSDIEQVAPEDQETLVKCNVTLMYNATQSIILGNRTGRWGFVDLLHSSLSNVEDDFRLKTLKRVFQESIGGHEAHPGCTMVSPPGLNYDQVFSSPWAPNIDLENRHKELTRKICQWPLDHGSKAGYHGSKRDHDGSLGGVENVDRTMVVLLAHSLMFNTDFVKLKEPQRVSQIQLQYLSLLHRYLKFKYEHSDFANRQLHSGVMIGSFAREREEIRRQRLPV